MPELIVTLKGREIQRYGINHRQVLIGRETRNDLVLPNESVSRNHATLSYFQNRFWIEGVNAKNGVWLNQQPCAGQTQVNDGDFLQIGKYKLKFSLHTGPSLNLLQEDDFGTREQTQALSVIDLESYSQSQSANLQRSLEEMRQDKLDGLERTLSQYRAALGLSIVINLALSYLLYGV